MTKFKRNKYINQAQSTIDPEVGRWTLDSYEHLNTICLAKSDRYKHNYINDSVAGYLSSIIGP